MTASNNIADCFGSNYTLLYNIY